MVDSTAEPRKFLRLADIEVYRISFALSNGVWQLVTEWDWLAQRTAGEQFVRAVDSISANVAEGFGRFSKKDKIRFYRIARGSLYESLDWNEKARARGLLTSTQYQYVFTELQRLPKVLNALIKYTDSHLAI